MNVLDCLEVQAYASGPVSVMFDTGKEGCCFWYADRDPDGKVRIKRAPSKSRIQVPLFSLDEMTLDVQEDLVCEMLLCALRWFPLMQNLAEVRNDAEQAFSRRDLALHTVLTNGDHRFIPPGTAIAVAEPMYVGRRVYSGDHERVGFVLLNRRGFRSYRYRAFAEQQAFHVTPFDKMPYVPAPGWLTVTNPLEVESLDEGLGVDDKEFELLFGEAQQP